MRPILTLSHRLALRAPLALSLLSVALLGACGGGSEGDGGSSLLGASPTYQLANVLPDVPSDDDSDGSASSALATPVQIGISTAQAAQPTSGLSGEDLQNQAGTATALSAAGGADGTASAAAATTSISVYTPAQIRAAYGFGQLPLPSPANLNAYAGAGQTIVIVDAFHNPNIANDLAVFSQKFGLAGCSSSTLTSATALPLAAPATSAGCSLVVAYSGTNGTVTSAVPAINKGWVTESSLDVEWAHAIAPMARIVLVEARSNGGADLLDAIRLAGKLGAGAVSMSFGAPEFSGWASVDSLFQTARVAYIASSGDSGYGTSWPATSPNVLAIGGTRLNYSGAARSETAWTGSGGGLSSYVSAPAWQSATRVPTNPLALWSSSTSVTLAAPRMRAVPDVAFNADPNSGQYVYVTPSTTTGGVGWLVAGGTSIGAPQWAGLVAIANALRGLQGKVMVGAVNSRVYGAVANTSLSDITTGNAGSCIGCQARSGFDLVTGLGTPNAAAILSLLAI
jgi:subtilase family serine protease